jgi:hypothetical protein
MKRLFLGVRVRPGGAVLENDVVDADGSAWRCICIFSERRREQAKGVLRYQQVLRVQPGELADEAVRPASRRMTHVATTDAPPERLVVERDPMFELGQVMTSQARLERGWDGMRHEFETWARQVTELDRTGARSPASSSAAPPSSTALREGHAGGARMLEVVRQVLSLPARHGARMKARVMNRRRLNEDRRMLAPRPRAGGMAAGRRSTSACAVLRITSKAGAPLGPDDGLEAAMWGKVSTELAPRLNVDEPDGAELVGEPVGAAAAPAALKKPPPGFLAAGGDELAELINKRHAAKKAGRP